MNVGGHFEVNYSSTWQCTLLTIAEKCLHILSYKYDEKVERHEVTNMLGFLYALFFRRQPSSPTLPRLELLPDELLLEILSYLSISDLFHGWLNLNWHLNVILHNLPIKKIYIESRHSWWRQWWYSWQNPNDAEPLRYFAFQLVSLQTHKCLSLSLVNNIDILNYPNLRILKLSQPTPTQLDVIQEQNFRHLEYLSLLETKKFSFEILCQFNSLRSCELWSIKIDDKHSCSSSSIRSLILRDCHPSNLIHLLRHLPQMTSFKVGVFWTNAFVDKFDSTAVFVHPNLKSLDISMYKIDSSINEINADRCDVVSALLAHVSPCLRIRCHLSLINMSKFNFEQLQRSVIEFKSFRFSCLLIYSLDLHPLPNFDRIRQLPLFNRLNPICTRSDIVIMYHKT